MSRHIVNIENPEAGETHAVIGYDRMLNQHYVQVYTLERDGHETVTREFDGDAMITSGVRMNIPDALVFLLIREAAGIADTNVCMDWRAGDPRVPESRREA